MKLSNDIACILFKYIEWNFNSTKFKCNWKKVECKLVEKIIKKFSWIYGVGKKVKSKDTYLKRDLFINTFF
jgi:hypothetical protein